MVVLIYLCIEIVSDEICNKASSCALKLLMQMLEASKKSRLKAIKAGAICMLVELPPESSRSKCERIMQLINFAFVTVFVSYQNNLLSSWDSKVDCCKWKGVICSNSTGHVEQLHLRNNPSLQGQINPSLLNLSQNNLRQTIPSVRSNSQADQAAMHDLKSLDRDRDMFAETAKEGNQRESEDEEESTSHEPDRGEQREDRRSKRIRKPPVRYGDFV
ncbi:hypothetical protein SASPL_131279 [Salvia splendens]|uniref:Leucine-rich repeat-containing N-terminal plant-type domain-containing protein n=1 Tax=Salvia splendens TaxID=180675 RepID=A0A8X8X8S8_SALSN|nr:hypothetical protein SASPL_131279 [Salvia splendens]